MIIPNDAERQRRVRRVLRKARAILARPVEDIGQMPERSEPEADDETQGEKIERIITNAARDPVDAWRKAHDRDAAAPEPQERPKQHAQQQQEQQEQVWSGWEKWLRLRLDEERDRIFDYVGTAIGELLDERKDGQAPLREELHELKIEVAKLTSEVAVLRELRASEGAIDLPNPLSPRHSQSVN